MNRKREGHGVKDTHPAILAHPRPSFGREPEAKFIAKI